MVYEIEYKGIDENTHKQELKILLVEGSRNTMLATVKDFKDRGIEITEVCRVNKDSIYTPIKF
ncbi:hypothetical protein IJD44_07670 [bacterium]|nr:hypothetical protein [bacterium]